MAAPIVEITGMATGPAPDDDDITSVTSNRIDVAMNLQGFTNAQLQSLKLEINNVTTKQTATITAVPEPVAQSTIHYVVKNVPLTEGLNKITPVLDTLRFTPGWVYYTPATSISNLTVNGETFADDRFFPANPAADTLLIISGRAPNASSLKAFLNGSTEEKSVRPDPQGNFNITADTVGTRFVDLNLQAGDNLITMIATNSSRTYTQQRSLLFDDGGPFAFHATIKETGATSEEQKLFLKPVLESASVDIGAKLKVNKDAAGVLAYNQVTVMSGATPLGTYDLVVPGDSLNGEPDGETDVTDNLPVNPVWTPTGPDDDYVVFDFARSLTLSSGNRNQKVDFVFKKGAVTEVGSSFDVSVQDSTQPYVNYVEMRIGASTSFIRMSEAPLLTEITQQPVTFRVHFSGPVTAATGVKLRRTGIGGADISGGTPDAVNVAGKYVDITFNNNFPGGDFGATFFPVQDGTTDRTGNGRTYQFTVSSVPYITFQNLTQGEVLTTADTGRTIRFRTVNIPDIAAVRIEVNNHPVTIEAGGTPNVHQFLFEGRLVQGANTIKVSIFEDTARTKLISSTTWNVFLNTVNIPEFVDLSPVEAAGRDDFKTTNLENNYVTNLFEVSFAGTVKEANQGTLEVIGGPQEGPQTLTFSGNTISTGSIRLAPTGNTTFVFKVTNNSGIEAIRAITIRREVLPYEIISPITMITPEGDTQANVNANFVKFEVKAEASDRILVDGLPAFETDVPDVYEFEVRDLKAGKNNVEFTIVRGTEELDVEVVVINVNTVMDGASYKTTIGKKVDIFNKQLKLSFPKGTNLKRNDPEDKNTFVTADRQILFGIANSTDGRIDKIEHDAEGSAISELAGEERIRFNAVSPLFWIDAGTVEADEDDLELAYRGSGQDPYATPKFYLRHPDDQMVPTAAGTLTLSYNPVIRQDGWKYVTVFHFDYQELPDGDMGWAWQNIGGVVDPGKNTITVPLYRFGYYQVMYMDQSFNDVIAHDWARNDLDVLYSKGYMFNKEDDWFRPYDPMTRGEFATLLVKAFDIPLNYDGDPTFSDVPRIDITNFKIYSYRYIETAARAGIVRGMEENKFNPNGGITREQAAVMIARAANLKLDPVSEKLTASLQKEFTDANDIESYAQPAVNAVLKEGYIEGIKNLLLPGQKKETFRFEPDTAFTRDQGAAVLIRVLREARKIPK